MESNQLNNTSNEDAVAELLTLTCEVDIIGTKRYRNKDGLIHRIHGPAIIYNSGALQFWQNGKCHREDGPACIWPDGTSSHYINNIYFNKNQFIQWQIENGIKPIE